MPAKIRFVLQVRLKAGKLETFLSGYDALLDRLNQGVPGMLAHQACVSLDDPSACMITSEWENLDTYQAWEVSPEHRALTLPLRACWDEAKLVKYVIRAEARTHTEP